MFRWKKRSPESKSIQTFVDALYQFEKEHPDELCPPETEAQLVIDCLRDVFLGVDWYTVLPGNQKQVNTIILDQILTQYSSEYRKLIEKKRKDWPN